MRVTCTSPMPRLRLQREMHRGRRWPSVPSTGCANVRACERAGLRAWPLTRRAEADLRARVAQAVEPDVYNNAVASGAGLSHREAVALVRGDG